MPDRRALDSGTKTASMMEDTGELAGEERLEGRYANYFRVGHNAFEFLLDFGQFFQESPEPVLHSRIVTGPTYAKVFFKTVRDSIEQYERTFGPIEEG